MNKITHFSSRFMMAFLFLFMGAGPLLIVGIDSLFPFIDPMTQSLLGLNEPLSRNAQGSGDSTFNYLMQTLSFMLALIITLVWSAAQRFQAPNERWARALRLLMRYYLSVMLWAYGTSKVFKTQFPNPSLIKLSQPLGDTSPMGLAWVYMGYSHIYNLFAGGLECLGSLLLLFPQTTLLGSLLNLGVMGNIFMMNLSFDIPVKINSGMYILMSLWLIWPDRWRVMQFFIQNQAVDAPAPTPAWPWYKQTIKWLILGTLFFNMAWSDFNRPQRVKAEPDLLGVYTLIPGSQKHSSGSPLEKIDWHQWVFDFPTSIYVRRYRPEKAAVEWIEYQRFNKDTLDLFIKQGEKTYFSALSYQHKATQTDFKGNLCEIAEADYKYDNDLEKYVYDRQKIHTSCLSSGKPASFAFSALRKQAEDYLLVNRGFHWINEFPYNR